MSQQPTGLRWSVQLARRHKFLVSAVTVAGLAIGVGYATLHPPLPSSEAIIFIPQNAPNIGTEVYIAGSEPVLSDAVQHIQPPMSLQTLENQVQAKSVTSGLISVTVKGTTAAQAESAANAVANSYIAYVGQASNPAGHVSAQLLQHAITATSPMPVKQDVIYGLIGALAGLLAGIATAIIVGRLDRRLRGRDDIANSIGVPVLAAVTASHPSDAAEWTKLLDDYEPGAVEGWRLRQALEALGFTGPGVNERTPGGPFSMTVLSMTSDPGAIALGPQFAVYAAAIGIPTVLVVGPQQDMNATAALWTACAAPPGSSKRPAYLRTVAADGARVAVPQGAKLVVVVAAVDGKAPQLPDTMFTTTTVLAVSAGAGTAEQFAQIATVAAADGREVAGFLVADPESADQSTGRIPRPAGRVRRMPAAPAAPQSPKRVTTSESRRLASAANN